MANLKTWFVIINPTSGNGSGKKKWPKIQNLLKTYGFSIQYAFTEFDKHSGQIVKTAIEKGFVNIISVGGDGTLHNIVNGIMRQIKTPSTYITVGVIPIGTGNDWIKTHNIPMNTEKVIQLIKKGNTKLQDVGKIEFANQDKEPVFFINLAGVGFDGHVVSNIKKYKRFGAISYLIGVLLGLTSFKNFRSKVLFNSKEISGKTLMVLMGLCKYSGGGMQLTKSPNPFDGLFDVSVAKNFSKLDVIKNVFKIFNGNIVKYKKVETHKCSKIIVEIIEDNQPFIQADGELIGKGSISVSLFPKCFSFYCN